MHVMMNACDDAVCPVQAAALFAQSVGLGTTVLLGLCGDPQVATSGLGMAKKWPAWIGRPSCSHLIPIPGWLIQVSSISHALPPATVVRVRTRRSDVLAARSWFQLLFHCHVFQAC